MTRPRSQLVRMEICFALLLFIIASISFASVAAAAYSIDWVQVQYRVYENATTSYRFGFALKDSTTNKYVTDGSVVTNAVLKDPNGTVVNYTNFFFEVYQEEDASYNGTSYQTTAPLYTGSDYGGTLQGPLVVGKYTLELSLRDGSKLSKQYSFNQKIDLPIISSSSFIVTSNISGDFCVRWQGVTSAAWPNTSQRVLIDFYSSDTSVAEMYVIVPTDVHEICIPRSVLKAFASSIGPFDQVKYRIQLRTIDNNNRSYSNSYTLDLARFTSYYINFLAVQHRQYEDSLAGLYRFIYILKDSSTGLCVTDASVVTNAVLKDPNGVVVNYTNSFFEVYQEEDASYDGALYQTTVPRYTTSDYGGTLQGPLVVGKYTLELSLRDGSKVARQYSFNEEIDLPIISSSSFIVTSNISGDFCVRWQGVTSAAWPNTSQRVLIDFYSSETLIAELFVVIPTDVHEVCIPRSVLKNFTSSIGAYNQARFRVQLRTNDNNNRTYSNYYPINLELRGKAMPWVPLLLGD